MYVGVCVCVCVPAFLLCLFVCLSVCSLCPTPLFCATACAVCPVVGYHRSVSCCDPDGLCHGLLHGKWYTKQGSPAPN